MSTFFYILNKKIVLFFDKISFSMLMSWYIIHVCLNNRNTFQTLKQMHMPRAWCMYIPFVPIHYDIMCINYPKCVTIFLNHIDHLMNYAALPLQYRFLPFYLECSNTGDNSLKLTRLLIKIKSLFTVYI